MVPILSYAEFPHADLKMKVNANMSYKQLLKKPLLFLYVMCIFIYIYVMKSILYMYYLSIYASIIQHYGPQ